jgi:hypothetical protein
VIDWISIIFNSFWITGLALILATFSYYEWEARQTKTQLREKLKSPQFLKIFWLSFILITISLAGTSGKVWETVIWGLFVLIGLINMVRVSTQQ